MDAGFGQHEQDDLSSVKLHLDVTENPLRLTNLEVNYKGGDARCNALVYKLQF